jgi:hypothetical protein
MEESRIQLEEKDGRFSMYEWCGVCSAIGPENSCRHRLRLAIALTFLCISGGQNIAPQETDFDFVWEAIFEALSDAAINFTVSRSAQGFFGIPLWSFVNDGDVYELFSLHVWLDDGKRGIPDLAIHAHQCFT